MSNYGAMRPSACSPLSGISTRVFGVTKASHLDPDAKKLWMRLYGARKITASGLLVGRVYELRASADLKPWTPDTAVTATAGSAVWTVQPPTLEAIHARYQVVGGPESGRSGSHRLG